MRYGLITIHATQNFGSLLQTFSTYEAIRSLNKNIKVIDYRNSVSERELPYTDKPVKSLSDMIIKVLWGPDQKKKYDSMSHFLNKNLSLSDKYYSSNIENANQEFDAFITGSDIVWGTNVTNGDLRYFLDFSDESKKRFAFSASIGTKWTKEEAAVIKPLLKRYDKISVREQMAADWINELTGMNVTVTCDPTMLWRGKFWSEFIRKEFIPQNKYVLIYATNPDHKNITDGISYARKRGLDAYFINFYKPVLGTKTIKPTTVEEWITLFANAEIVFSASYHGLLYSLYFHRPVFYYNRGEKSRMVSLAKELGIEDREGTDGNLCLDKAIDYEKVDKTIEEKRANSWNYLREILL